MEIRKIDRNSLVDIKNIHINTNLSAEQRVKHYLEQVKNPYCFMCGKTLVRIGFTGSERPLGEGLKNYFLNLKN